MGLPFIITIIIKVGDKILRSQANSAVAYTSCLETIKIAVCPGVQKKCPPTTRNQYAT